MTPSKSGLLAAILLLFGSVCRADALHSSAVSGRYMLNGSPEEVLGIVSSVNRRHPKLIVSQTRFRGNLPLLYKSAFDLKSKLSLPEDRFFIPDELPALSMRLTSTGASADFLPENLEKLKTHLVETIGELRAKAPEWRPAALKELLENPFFKKDTKLAGRLIKIMPWFLDLEGELLPDFKSTADVDKVLIQQIENAGGTTLSSLYYDLYFEHLRPKLEKLSYWQQVASAFQNTFVEKELNMYLKLEAGQQGHLKSSTLSIELVPPLVALLRGAVGYDCSMRSVPLYALLPGTDVFWIRRSSDTKSQPSGYALVTQARVNGKLIPYVVTVNGQTVNALDTRAALILIAKYYGVTELLTPDFSASPHVVNDEIKKVAMRGEESFIAELSDEWKHLSKSEFARLDPQYALYYSPENLQHARKTKITDQETFEFTKSKKKIVTRDAYKPHDYKDLSLYERSMLAASFNNDEKEMEPILAALRVTELQLASARLLLSEFDSGLSRDQINSYAWMFEITAERVVLTLSEDRRRKTLVQNNFQEPWATKAAIKLAATIDDKLRAYLQMGGFSAVDGYMDDHRQLEKYAGVPNAKEACANVLADFYFEDNGHRAFERELLLKLIQWKGPSLNERLFVQLARGNHSTDFSRILIGHFLDEGGEVAKRALHLWMDRSKNATGMTPLSSLADITASNLQQWTQLLVKVRTYDDIHFTHAPLFYLAPFQKHNIEGIKLVLKVYAQNFIHDERSGRYYFRDNNQLAEKRTENKALRDAIWEFIRISLVNDPKPIEEVFLAAPAFFQDKANLTQLLAARFDDFVTLPGFVESVSQMHSTALFEMLAAQILLHPKVSSENKIQITKKVLLTARGIWPAFTEIIRNPDSDQKLVQEVLYKVRGQPIWPKDFWDAMLALVQSPRATEVAYEISKAYEDRLIPASHRQAIVQLIKKLPDNGIRNILRQVQIRNTGIELTTFPEPKGVPYKNGRECQLDLLQQFGEQTNSQPNWIMRQYQKALQWRYPRWR